ncbi:MAG: hypothetical protein HY303_10960 [Candidatus Wallbacteria bacterium]|nr:hypothetical protein [Candidatus Wallbacteria bacterium]
MGDSKAVFLERGMMEDRIDAQTLGEHVCVAWRRWHSEADHVLEFSESPDGGATWSKPVVVAGPGRPIVEMSFAWPPEGPRLAWLEGDGAGQRMAVSKRPTGSRAWSPPAAVASARAVAGQGKGVDNPNGAIDYAMTAHGFRWAVPPGDLSGTPLERAPGTRGAPKPYRVLTTSSGKLALLCSSPAPGKPRAAYLAPVDESGQVLRKRLRPISDPRHDVVTVGAIGRGPTVVVAEEVSEQIWVQASSDAGATFTAAALVFPDQRETRKFGLADSGGVFHIAVLQLGVMQVTGRLLLASSVDGRSWAPWASMRLPLHSEREVALAASGPRLIAFISDQIDGLMTLTLPLPGSR